MELRRTHNCGELDSQDISKTVILSGWVDRRRDHGGLIFIDLRDRWGITQIRIEPVSKAYKDAKRLRSEFVVSFKGIVVERPEGMINKKLKTGEIEIVAEEIEILNESLTPPLHISGEVNSSEDLRLKYRYLDLRRPEMQKNFLIRHKLCQIVRQYFSENNFVEVETPFLMKSTPEGARDFLVPSRVWNGRFYALPQSPQTYKQLLMVAGFDRYFQIVKCFRDEDLRADRQPEFTQIDVEMSFIDVHDIIAVVENLMVRIFKNLLDIEIKSPFIKIPYSEAMSKYGSDKPDLRFDLQIFNISDLVVESDFKVFSDTVKSGNVVAGICARNCAGFSRKQIDDLIQWVKDRGAKGLAAIKVKGTDWEGSLNKFFTENIRKNIVRKMDAKDGDLLLFLADTTELVFSILGDLRIYLAKNLKLISENEYKLAWIVDFPLFEYNSEEKRYVARHHPFTSPKLADIDKILTEPEKVQARAYDLVLNGMEIAGGSIRISNTELQQKMFRALGIGDEEANDKFGFLLEALNYGAPPHGGIAFGLDRLVMILAKCISIREVIAFPKTASAMSLMDNAPSVVSQVQLDELGIKLKK
ncbi:aspartate--tRNA ligase [candidate division KSB1 bacterium]|nr:aspartate--tRNA ligase [candidate division KSB1 bacterium]